jgi:hypothetical protein
VSDAASPAGTDDQRRIDLVRVRSYALACCDAATRAREELEASLDSLVFARETAEQQVERLRCACDLAERVGRFAARASDGAVEPETLAEAAKAIEELVG